MATVLIPSALRRFSDGQAKVEIPGQTIKEVLDTLVQKYPDLHRHLIDERGRTRSFVNVFLGEEDVRHLKQESTPVQEGDTVSIVPAVAGGME